MSPWSAALRRPRPWTLLSHQPCKRPGAVPKAARGSEAALGCSGHLVLVVPQNITCCALPKNQGPSGLAKGTDHLVHYPSSCKDPHLTHQGPPLCRQVPVGTALTILALSCALCPDLDLGFLLGPSPFLRSALPLSKPAMSAGAWQEFLQRAIPDC